MPDGSWIARKVLFIGGSGVAKPALIRLQHMIPKLRGVALDGPMISDTQMSLLKSLNRLFGRSVQQYSHDFFGFGAPKQEYIMERIKNEELRIKNGLSIVVMTVEGVLIVVRQNTICTTLDAATRLEWFWRLLQEPWRWKRQWVLLQFIWNVLRWFIYPPCASLKNFR